MMPVLPMGSAQVVEPARDGISVLKLAVSRQSNFSHPIHFFHTTHKILD